MKAKTALATADGAGAARQIFIPITRIDEEKREVWGYATTEQVDSFGTVFPFEASKRAYAEWNDNFERLTDGESKGNLRAMHQKIAAGKVIACEPDEEKRAIAVGAHVVDDKEWEKVKQRVYTGFSHGVLQTERSIFERRNGKLVEIVPAFEVQELSLADKPSCPGAVMTLFRRAAETAPPAATATVADPAPTSPEPMATSPAAAPTASEPTPTVDPPGEVVADEAPPAGATERVAVSLRFDVKRFMPETAAAWATGHDFRVRTAPEALPNATHIEIEQRAAKDYAELQAVPLADGVELVTGILKTESLAARFGEILRLVEPEIVRAAQSQEYTILPSLTALAALCQAISSVMYSYDINKTPETAKGDIAALTTAAEAILDFVGSRLAEQLSSLSGEAERLAKSELERFTQLPRVLSRAQLERLMSEEETRATVGSMHEIGHALCEATMKMGGECRAGACSPGETEEERIAAAAPPAIPRAGFPSPQEVGLRHTAGGKSPAPARVPRPAAAAPATAQAAATTERASTGNDQVLQAIAQVAEQVKGLETRITSVDERVAQVASMPAPIGRPPAAPVDKTLAGASPPAPTPQNAAAVSAELQRLAGTVNDPALRYQLVLQAAALQAPGASPAGQAQRP